MMIGLFSEGKEKLPLMLHISISQYQRDLPKTGESLQFLISIHEEGTGDNLATERDHRFRKRVPIPSVKKI